MSWQDSALCAEVGTELFFPPDTENPNQAASAALEVYALARRVCAACPVTAQCLSEAMAFERGVDRQYRYGVWGGKTPGERFALERTDMAAA